MMVFDVKIFLKFTAMPATPPSKGGETYLFINQIIMVVFDITIILKLMAMGDKEGEYAGYRRQIPKAESNFN